MFIRCSLLISKLQFHYWYKLLISIFLLPNPIQFLSVISLFPQKNQLWILKIYCMKWCASELALNKIKHYLVWFPQCEDSHQRQFQATSMILLIMELGRGVHSWLSWGSTGSVWHTNILFNISFISAFSIISFLLALILLSFF